MFYPSTWANWAKSRCKTAWKNKKWPIFLFYGVIFVIVFFGWLLLEERLTDFANTQLDKHAKGSMNWAWHFVTWDFFPILAWLVLLLLGFIGFFILLSKAGSTDRSIWNQEPLSIPQRPKELTAESPIDAERGVTYSTVKPSDERDFVDLSPNDLVGFFRADETNIQSRRKVEPLIGKWIKVEGNIGEVLSSFGPDRAQVTFSPPPFTGELGHLKQLYMIFRGKELVQRLYPLKKGAHIVVEGQIERADLMEIQLDNCKLIR